MPKFQIEDVNGLEMVAFLSGDKDESQVSPKTVEQAERMIKADNLLYRYGSAFRVSKMLIKRYGYSRRSAYTDIDNAKIFFGSLQKPQKEYYRTFLLNHYMAEFTNAAKEGDRDGMAKIGREITRILMLDQEDSKLPDFGKVQPGAIKYVFDTKILNVSLPQDFKGQLIELVEKVTKGKNVNTEEMFRNIPDGE